LKLLILDRYLIREVLRPLILVLTLLVLIFVGYTSAEYLAGAASGLLDADVIAILIVLKAIIALEVLVPIALYLTVVWTLARLGRTREMTAMAAAGYGPGRALLALAGVSLPVALLVGVLSVWVRPMAYRQAYEVQARAEVSIDFEDLEPGRFYRSDDGRRVVFVEETKTDPPTLEGLFLWLDNGGSALVVRAERARQLTVPGSERGHLELQGLRAYELGRERARVAVLADRLVYDLEAEDVPIVGYKRKAIPTSQLSSSTVPKEVAEFQWRVTRPVSTLLMGLLAALLAFAPPRRRRGAAFLVAVLAWLAIYQGEIAARTWVETGKVGFLPGSYWMPALVFLVVVLLAWRRLHGRWFPRWSGRG